jgi:hypothetical protein
MEKFNFPGGKNVVKSICWILSYLSWLLAVATNLAALKWMYRPQKNNPFCFIWNILIIPNYLNYPEDNEDNIRRRLNSPAKRNIRKLANGPDYSYIPLQMSELMIYIVLNFAFAMIFAGCVVYIVKTFIKRDIQAIDGLFGKFSQFHFFPFLCNFVMSLLGILSGNDMEKCDDFAKAGLAISLIGLASMIFIYITTKSDSFDSTGKFFIKNGAFSCLIVLFWYSFCYDIYMIRMLTEGEDQKWVKGCSLAFSIIFGVGSLSFSFLFKDVMVSFMNILIYIGMAKNYFELELNTSTKDYNKNGDGAVDIIMLVCSMILFLFLIYDDIMNKITEIKSQIFSLGQVQTQTIVKVNANSNNINLLSSTVNPNVQPIESSERKL